MISNLNNVLKTTARTNDSSTAWCNVPSILRYWFIGTLSCCNTDWPTLQGHLFHCAGASCNKKRDSGIWTFCIQSKNWLCTMCNLIQTSIACPRPKWLVGCPWQPTCSLGSIAECRWSCYSGAQTSVGQKPHLPWKTTGIYAHWYCSKYAVLEAAAYKYLFALTTSVANEQLFSAAWQLYADGCSNLLGENAEKLFFYHKIFVI